MMMSRGLLLQILLLCGIFASGVIGMSSVTPKSTPPQPPSSNSADCPSAFGISNIIGLRGGEVIEGTSASEVDAMIIKAGSAQQLVVIDFTATWQVCSGGC
jgi:hypothetical protein